MLHNYEDPSFVPPTYLMDEVRPGQKYELVLTVLKGGALRQVPMRGYVPLCGAGKQGR